MCEKYSKILLIFLYFTILISIISLACKAQLPFGETSTPGIDEPALIKSVSMTCPIVGDQINDVELTLKSAYSSEKVLSKDADHDPRNGFIFYTLITDLHVRGNCLDILAISKQLILKCDNERYEPLYSGVNVDLGEENNRKGFSFTYEILKNTSVDKCFLTFPDGQSVPIAPMISD